jgi:hypothetical protein
MTPGSPGSLDKDGLQASVQFNTATVSTPSGPGWITGPFRVVPTWPVSQLGAARKASATKRERPNIVVTADFLENGRRRDNY